VDYFNGCHWLNQARPADLSLSGYVQTLDMRRGMLSTRYDWMDCNRATHVEVTAFPARNERPSIFLTAEGAFLQQSIFGFTGLRFSSGGLSPRFPPMLPAGWQDLELRGINLNGKKRTIRIQQGGKLVIE
jgi:trehalose/maltose hydrolase-like predicted phosphorylase